MNIYCDIVLSFERSEINRFYIGIFNCLFIFQIQAKQTIHVLILQ